MTGWKDTGWKEKPSSRYFCNGRKLERSVGPFRFEIRKNTSWRNENGNALYTLEIHFFDGENTYRFGSDWDNFKDNLKEAKKTVEKILGACKGEIKCQPELQVV